MNLIAFTIVAELLVACVQKPGDKYQLVWSDEFNKDGMPDTASWTYDIGHGSEGWGNNELQYYTRNFENVRIKDGILMIEARKKDGKWSSARLKTQGLKNWKYGKFVFSARLPEGKGTWPALWMLGENIASVGWPACGEMDIMEHVGKNPGVVQCALHTKASHGNTQNKQSRQVPTFSSEFHTYEAVWSERKIEFFIDDTHYFTYEPRERDNDHWPYHTPFFIIMNVAIGGNFGGAVDPALNNARMEVDYVRVYQRK